MKRAISVILLFAVSISLFGCKNRNDDAAETFANKTTIEQMLGELCKCHSLDIIADEFAKAFTGEFIDDCHIEKDKNGVEFKRTYALEDAELTCELVKHKNAMKISCDLGEIECEYSENGQLLHCTTSSGFTYTFLYADNGKCKSSTITSEEEEYVTEKLYDVEGSFEIRKYNANGEVVELIEYGNDESKRRTKYLFDSYYVEEYDCDGNPLKRTTYAGDGSVTDWKEYEYEYDEDGNTIKRSEYTSNGGLTGWTEYEYDGSKRKTTVYDSNGKVMDKYEYDEEVAWKYISGLTLGILSPMSLDAMDDALTNAAAPAQTNPLYGIVFLMLTGE